MYVQIYDQVSLVNGPHYNKLSLSAFLVVIVLDCQKLIYSDIKPMLFLTNVYIILFLLNTVCP